MNMLINYVNYSWYIHKNIIISKNIKVFECLYTWRGIKKKAVDRNRNVTIKVQDISRYIDSLDFDSRADQYYFSLFILFALLTYIKLSILNLGHDFILIIYYILLLIVLYA
jgi:hypothetical protein